jgi:tetratricopeptide (TPR) repeat protein
MGPEEGPTIGSARRFPIRRGPRPWAECVLVAAVWLMGIAASVPAASAQSAGDQIPRLLRSGDSAGALKLIDEALAHAPRDPRLWTLRGLALSQLEQLDESLAAYRTAVSLEPGYLPALQGAAQIEYGTRSPEAQRTLERILELDPANGVAHAMLAAVAYDRQDCATALGHIERADAAIRGNPQAIWQAAHCLFVEGRSAEAAERFEQLLHVGGLDSRLADAAVFNLALSLHTAGRHQRAIATLERLASRHSPDRDVLTLLADAYAANQQVEQAVATLRRATTVYPRDEQFYVALATLCVEHDSFDLGREIAEIGLKNVPGSERLYALRGIIHAQLGAFDQAQADFERVAQLAPQQPAAIAGLSLTLEQTGQVEQSIAILREQARLRPNDHAIQVLFAQTLLRSARDDTVLAEARGALLRAVAASPRDAAVRTELGKVYLKTGESEKAIEQLQKAVELDPSDKTATYHLLLALRKAGRDKASQQLVDRVRALLDNEKASEIARNRFRLMKAEPDAERKR